MRKLTSVHSLPVALIASCLLGGGASAQEGFRAMRYIDTDTLGGFKLAGDLDNDGDVDLLEVPSDNSDGVYVWLNDGATRFERLPYLSLSTNFAEQVGESGGGLGDFDGDGILDLVVESYIFSGGDNHLEFLRGRGDGTFDPPIDVALPDDITPGMIAADRDGDGVPEVAVGIERPNDQALVLWVSRNAGSFVVSPSVSLGLQFGEMALVDLDGDNSLDILVLSKANDQLAIAPTVAGAPTLGPQLTLPPSVLGSTERALLAGDIDGDGNGDALVYTRVGVSASLGENRFVLLLGDGAGNLSVASQQTIIDPFVDFAIDLEYGDSRPKLVDWDADGDLDIMHATSDAWTDEVIFIENTDGTTFEVVATYPGVGASGGIADLNGDGRDDFFTQAGFVLNGGAFGRGFIEDSSLGNVFPSNLEEILDWDGDGDLDSLSSNGLLLVNNAMGSFSGPSSVLPAPANGAFYSAPVAIGDFDADGRRDVIVRSSVSSGPGADIFTGMRLLAGLPGGGFEDVGLAAPSKLEIQSTVGPWLNADIDGDGDVDLLKDSGYHANQGSGFFLGAIPAFDGVPLAAADIDADGDVDLLVRQVQTFPLPTEWRVLRNEGVNQLGAAEFSSELLVTPDDELSAFVFGDLDGDNDLDLVRGIESGNGIDVFENMGASFTLRDSLRANGPNTTFWVADPVLFDFDSDGLLDIATIRREFSSTYAGQGDVVSLYPQVGGGDLDFEFGAEWWVGLASSLFDADGDGDLDAVGFDRVLGTALDGPEAGAIRQYGEGTAGTDGVVPLLGLAGPVVQGANAELRLLGGLGAAPAIFGIGLIEANLIDFPFPGLTLLIDNFVYVQGVALDGAPGVAGDGEYRLPFNVSANLAGVRFFHQFLILDAASPSLLVQSNGLEVLYGE